MTRRGRQSRLRPGIIALLTEESLTAWQIADRLGFQQKSVQVELRCMRILGVPCLANLLDGRIIKRQPGVDPVPAPKRDNVGRTAEDDETKKSADDVVESALRSRHPLDDWLR